MRFNNFFLLTVLAASCTLATRDSLKAPYTNFQPVKNPDGSRDINKSFNRPHPYRLPLPGQPLQRMEKRSEGQGTHFPLNTRQSVRQEDAVRKMLDWETHFPLRETEFKNISLPDEKSPDGKAPLEVMREKTLEIAIQTERQGHLKELFKLLKLSKDQEQGIIVEFQKKPKVTMDKFYKTLSDANILQMEELPKAINHLPRVLEKTTKSDNFHPAALLILNLANELLAGST
jgi:hypothetical protein